VDSHSLIFQVFHAIPPMTSPTGIPTNAVFGFARDMMFLRSKKPDFLACAWDKPEPTFRSEIYQEYKAHRDPPPDDLLIQLPLIEELCRVLNIPILGISGFEADDILATIAKMSSTKDVNTYLCTTDKDCRQLITDNVFLYNLRKQTEFGKKELLKDWGVTPEQVVDLQTLVGDSVDNIPGATGIGIKTASTLLQQYGNLENIFRNIANISGTKRKENLEAFREKAPMVRKLVELCQNAPVSEDWENWSVRDIHAQEALDFFKKLGFRGLQSQMERILSNQTSGTLNFGTTEIPQEKSTQTRDYPVFNASPTRLEISAPIKLQGFDGWKHEYETILTAEQLEQLILSLNQCGLFSFDLETTGLDPIDSKIVGIAFALEPHRAFYVPLLGPVEAKILPYAETLSKLKPLLESPACKKNKSEYQVRYPDT